MIKLTFTGDAMCEYTRLPSYFDKKTKRYDFTELFQGLAPYFRKADYTVVNLETPLAGKEMKYSYKNYNFNTPAEFAKALQKFGVNMVTTANNHVLDRGKRGLRKTVEELDRIGLEHTGSFASAGESHPLIKDIDGFKIAFLSYTYGTEACFNHCYLKKNEAYMVNLTRNQELRNPVKRYFLLNSGILAKIFRFFYRVISPEHAKRDVSLRKEKDKSQKQHILDDIKYCKTNGADYIIMCLHCGGQFNKTPTRYTKQVSQFCHKHGVDFVIGNHEHCIQSYDRKNKVVYSLGNLTSDYGISRPPYGRLAEYSVLFHLYLKKNGDVIETEAGFSFAKSVMQRDGKIVTKPVYDLYHAADDKKKKIIAADIKKCIRIFLNEDLDFVEIKEEYLLKDFKF